MPEPAARPQDPSEDLYSLLDQGLSRLPDKYRAVIVLCDLEGKTRKEAARHFRLPEGTVASRLATARSMLAKRLARQGLKVSAGALATLLARQTASAGLPPAVASGTIKAASLFVGGQAAAGGALSVRAVALAEGVVKTMLLTRLKITTAVLLALALLSSGAAALTRQVLADQSPDPLVGEQPQPIVLADRTPDEPVPDKLQPAIQLVKEQKSYWPQWRGPTGMGHCDEKNLPLTWDAKSGTNILWKVPLPGGERNSDACCPSHSCPIVWGDRVFVTTAVYPAGKSFRDSVIAQHHVLCYRAGDGKLLWDTTVPDGRCCVNNPWHGYTTPTPVTDGQHVFALFGSSVLACVDFDGKLVWREELPRTREKDHSGECSSPILYEDTVIVAGCQTIRGLRAHDKKTGQLKWQQKPNERNEHNTMSTPILIRVGDRTQLIHCAGGIRGLDPATGDLLWSCRVSTDWASPVYGSGILYADAGDRPTFPVASPADMGAAIDPTGKGDVTKTHVKWKTRVPEADGASPIVVGDYLYRVSKPDLLRCYTLATGQPVYAERLQGISTMASPIATADGRIYIACAARSYVVKAGPRFELLGSGELSDGADFHTPTPAVSEGRLFIKGRTHLWCIGTK